MRREISRWTRPFYSMFGAHSFVWLIAIAASVAPACASSYEVATVRNVERAATIWKDRELGLVPPHLCLEFSTAAEKLDSRKANLKVPIGITQAAEASYESSASLAQIYTVSDIMQFGHATLYRLCEAAGNGDLDKAEYAGLVKQVLENVHALLELQMTGTRIGVLQQIKGARLKIQDLSKQLEELQSSPSATAAEDEAQIRHQLAESKQRYENLLKLNDVVDTFQPVEPIETAIAARSSAIASCNQEISELKSKREALEHKKADKTQPDSSVDKQLASTLSEIERKTSVCKALEVSKAKLEEARL